MFFWSEGWSWPSSTDSGGASPVSAGSKLQPGCINANSQDIGGKNSTILGLKGDVSACLSISAMQGEHGLREAVPAALYQ